MNDVLDVLYDVLNDAPKRNVEEFPIAFRKLCAIIKKYNDTELLRQGHVELRLEKSTKRVCKWNIHHRDREFSLTLGTVEVEKVRSNRAKLTTAPIYRDEILSQLDTIWIEGRRAIAKKEGTEEAQEQYHQAYWAAKCNSYREFFDQYREFEKPFWSVIRSQAASAGNETQVDEKRAEHEQQAQPTGPAEQAAGSAKSKRGPHRYSRAEKIAAVREWDALDKDLHPITLAEWLKNKFGAPYGALSVAESTFHGWRKLLKKS